LEEFHYEPKEVPAILKSEILSVVSIFLWIILLFALLRIAAKNLKAL
jgi:ABC-2 type transport system permease protein